MGELIARDDVQLRRIECAIARFEKLPPAEQLKKTYLLSALLAEQAELVRHGSRPRRFTPANGRSGLSRSDRLMYASVLPN